MPLPQTQKLCVVVFIIVHKFLYSKHKAPTLSNKYKTNHVILMARNIQIPD